jgi:site-specific recombinase XerD
LLRHASAGGGADLRTIQLLMGHERLEDTTIYLHLSQRHVHAAVRQGDYSATCLEIICP